VRIKEKLGEPIDFDVMPVVASVRGQISQYSDLLQAGRFGNRIQVGMGSGIFLIRPDRP